MNYPILVAHCWRKQIYNSRKVSKFKRWREEETKDYKGKMGYVKFGAKGRRHK